jgi:hypothetical protein
MTAATTSSTWPRRPTGCIAASWSRAAAGEFKGSGLSKRFYGVLARVVEAEVGDPNMPGDAARIDDCPSTCAQRRHDFVLHRRCDVPYIDAEHNIESRCSSLGALLSQASIFAIPFNAKWRQRCAPLSIFCAQDRTVRSNASQRKKDSAFFHRYGNLARGQFLKPVYRAKPGSSSP